jgi:hypothetical protein
MEAEEEAIVTAMELRAVSGDDCSLGQKTGMEEHIEFLGLGKWSAAV